MIREKQNAWDYLLYLVCQKSILLCYIYVSHEHRLQTSAPQLVFSNKPAYCVLSVLSVQKELLWLSDVNNYGLAANIRLIASTARCHT